jgi:hypothetical protein
MSGTPFWAFQSTSGLHAVSKVDLSTRVDPENGTLHPCFVGIDVSGVAKYLVGRHVLNSVVSVGDANDIEPSVVGCRDGLEKSVEPINVDVNSTCPGVHQRDELVGVDPVRSLGAREVLGLSIHLAAYRRQCERVNIDRTNKAHLAINLGDLQELVVENVSVDHVSKLWWELEKTLSHVLHFSVNLLALSAANARVGFQTACLPQYTSP